MKKYKVTDSPEFDSKRGLAKWIKIMLPDEKLEEGVEYTDGEMILFIDNKELLFKFLDSE